MAFIFQTVFRPLLALTWQGWRPLATSAGVRGADRGGIRHASPVCPHHPTGAANSLPLAVGSASPGANEAPKLQAIGQTSGPPQGRQDQLAEGLAAKFAGFTNFLVLVLVSWPASWSPRMGRDQPQISRMDLESARPPRVSAQRPDRACGQAVLPSSLGVLGPLR